jgi:hypothetical protein
MMRIDNKMTPRTHRDILFSRDVTRRVRAAPTTNIASPRRVARAEAASHAFLNS